jgi:hypothetical protein
MATAGISSFAYVHEPPLFVEMNNPISVPAQISFGLCGMTRREYVATSGNPLVLTDPDPNPEMSCQVCPRSVVRSILGALAMEKSA